MKIKQNSILIFLLAISILIVLLNDILLADTQEIFSFGDELGQILSNLSLAYISSYIFYYVVVVIKERQDKRNIYFTVYEWTKNLIGRAYSVYNDIISASGVSHTDYDKRTITKEEFTALCKQANPNAIPTNRFLGSPVDQRQATYGQFIYNGAVSYVKMYSEKIFNCMPFLDSEHVRLINQLHNSTFYLVAETFHHKTRNTDFSVYADNMYEFLEFVRELEDYNEKMNKKFAKK
jgi:hypothetical protein